jgi:polygalacturonase
VNAYYIPYFYFYLKSKKYIKMNYPKSNPKAFATLLTVVSIVLVLSSCQKKPVTTAAATKHFQDLYTNIEFEMPVVKSTSFQDYSSSIIDFGAIGDGTTLNTDAIHKAIIHVAEKGGGKVIIPRGIWLSGPIQLKSNINLHLEEGALLLFSRNFDDYPLVKTSFEGLNTYRCLSPISGDNLENIAITGKGIIDGNGDAWRPVKKFKLTEHAWNNLIASGGVLNPNETIWYPSEKSLLGAQSTGNFNVPSGMQTAEDFEEVKDFLRPVMISLVKCKRILLDGPTFQNSPAWNIHPLMCEDISLMNITVKNPWYSQNGDGLDLESCKNAIIYNCNFDVGDDAICIKSGKNKQGRERAIPTENVIIKSCVVYHGHGGFVVGSEMSSGVRNMHISNCTFIGTDVGLRFKSTRGRGGIVENIYISNIDMINIPTEAIRFNLYYGGSSPIPEPDDTAAKKIIKPVVASVTEETPEFRNIHIKNTRCIGAERAIKMVGLPEMKLKNFSFENIHIKSRYGVEITDAIDISFKNMVIDCEKEPVIGIVRSEQIVFDSIIHNDYQKLVVISDNECKNINFTKTSFSNACLQVITPEDSSDDIISIQ